MKKVMIVFPERKLKPAGGPAGYLYNLKKELDKLNPDEISFSFYNSRKVDFEEAQGLRNKIPKRVKDFRRALRFSRLLNKKLPVDEGLLEYDVLHFHSVEEMYFNRATLENYKGKVVLTSHTPCAPYQEYIGRLRPSDYRMFKSKVDNLVKMEEYAFKRADYVIFPCEEAEEPYFNTWQNYPRFRDALKYRYVPTGTLACSAKRSASEVRKEYNIPEDAFLICYAGRHNEIKGYSDLKKIGAEMLKDRDVYFIIAGREGPIYRLNNERWIEVGWTTDPHSLIAAADVFVLPNRETYFDLILLEVISLGTPMVLSRTGGNKYFQRYNSGGFMFYETVDEAVSQLRRFKNLTDSERRACGAEVREIFDKDFTVEVFAKNYIDTIKKIAQD